MSAPPLARTIAILPVKRFELAKTRLGEALTVAQRRRLARAMVADVLDALLAAPELDGVAVVTNESAVAALAREAGAVVLADPHESGQSAAALVGIAHALAGRFERALLVPGDCPALDGATLRTLLEGSPAAPSVTIVADRHGAGTNALLLDPPDAIEPAFGEGSFERHRQRARAAGAGWRVAALPGLALDIDTPADLAALRGALADAGPRTTAILGAIP
jgi:2-phospho-L-lactate guanylyltransferase